MLQERVYPYFKYDFYTHVTDHTGLVDWQMLNYMTQNYNYRFFVWNQHLFLIQDFKRQSWIAFITADFYSTLYIREEKTLLTLFEKHLTERVFENTADHHLWESFFLLFDLRKEFSQKWVKTIKMGENL